MVSKNSLWGYIALRSITSSHYYNQSIRRYVLSKEMHKCSVVKTVISSSATFVAFLFSYLSLCSLWVIVRPILTCFYSKSRLDFTCFSSRRHCYGIVFNVKFP